MHVQVNTGHNIAGHEALTARIRSVIERTLSRFSEQITRVEVHLRDENGAKSGQCDKRCMLEARLEGRQPIAVTHDADTVAEAVDGAAEKLQHVIESTLGRLRDHKGARG